MLLEQRRQWFAFGRLAEHGEEIINPRICGWRRRLGYDAPGERRTGHDRTPRSFEGFAHVPRSGCCAWQVKNGFQPGCVVLKPEFPAMEARDRRSQAQPEPGPRHGAALLKPDETFDHVAAVGFRNTGTGIAHRQL